VINIIKYGGQGTTKKDGKDLTINIPAPFILTQMGAFLDVIITHPRVVQEKLREQGKEIPIIGCDIKNFPCLIGRDILQHWYFTYNGPDGSIVICDLIIASPRPCGIGTKTHFCYFICYFRLIA
jgi:hypothetical protein